MKLHLRGDKVIFILVILLALISIMSVFSAGSYLVRNDPGGMSKLSIFWEQSRSVLMGLGALIICYFIPIGWFRKLAPFFFGITVVMLILLLIPSMRVEINGAVRGLKIGGATIQVFEFVKVGLIMYLAWAIEYFDGSMDKLTDYLLKLLLPVVAVCFFVLPNSFSTTLLLAAISLLIMFFMEVKWQHLTLTIIGALGVIALMFGVYHAVDAINHEKAQSVGFFNRFATVENRVQRFLSNEQDSVIDLSQLSAAEYARYDRETRQSDNAKIAIAEGGIFGKGPGRSTQRYSLSMAFSDFIFATIVEEWGLIGGIVIILIYLIFLFRCIAIANRCRALFSQALVLGLAFLLATQAFLHILVNVRLLPITGHTLPLVSHGGTAYLVLSAAFGIILNVSKALDKQEENAAAAMDIEREALEASSGRKKEDDYEENNY
ncbi:MAG: FtsW/RodA/SpoVE family cell cycle protein [Bacteroidales bacterium]|nr:FtsW/RodA/SpoVE family cell cycle protein [Bacteroidales bacterium]